MNERIRELADEAGVSITAANKNGVFTLLPDNQKKFAELIVRECTDLVQKYMTRWPEDCELTKQIKEHFGVEE